MNSIGDELVLWWLVVLLWVFVILAVPTFDDIDRMIKENNNVVLGNYKHSDIRQCEP